MSVDWKHEAIEQLDWHWRAAVRPRLNGLTDDEYFWEPVPDCWSIRPRAEASTALAAGKGDFVIDFEFPEPLPTPVTTIAWRLAHITVGLFEVRTDNHFGSGAKDWPDTELPATAADALTRLDAAYDGWMTAVGKLDDAGLAAKVGPTEGHWASVPFAALVLHINREVIHHSAEIALLRDLYARKNP
jgi:hypothetical protein